MGEESIGHDEKVIPLERTHVRKTMLEAFNDSRTFLQTTTTQLESETREASLRQIEIPKTLSFEKAQEMYPNQVVAILGTFQPDLGIMALGMLFPESQVITTRRSDQNSWGANTWTLPMGKIDPADVTSHSDSLGDVISRAAHREMEEEVSKRYTGGFMCIANSFLDETTGNLIHVMVNEIGDDNSINEPSLTLDLPDTREHSDIRWIKAQDLVTLRPMNNGTKYAILMALKFIEEQNKQSLESGRYS